MLTVTTKHLLHQRRLVVSTDMVAVHKMHPTWLKLIIQGWGEYANPNMAEDVGVPSSPPTYHKQEIWLDLMAVDLTPLKSATAEEQLLFDCHLIA